MPTTDPNVLFSTAAQATAALVAIVGGFLVSRLVALSSERGSLLQRVKELDASLGLAERRWREAHSERFAFSRSRFVEHHFDDFIKARGDVDIDAALKDFVPIGSSADEMRPVAEKLAARIKSAFERIGEAFRGAEYPSGRIDHLRERIPDIAEGDENLYERVGEILTDERRRSGLFAGVNPSTLRIPAYSFPSDIVLQRQDARIRDELSLRAEVDALTHERDFVLGEVHRFGRPEGVGVGVLVLTIFSLVGIVFPMVMMSLRPVPDGQFVRVAAIATFASGLLLLLWYIWWLVRKLRPLKPGSPDNA